MNSTLRTLKELAEHTAANNGHRLGRWRPDCDNTRLLRCLTCGEDVGVGLIDEDHAVDVPTVFGKALLPCRGRREPLPNGRPGPAVLIEVATARGRHGRTRWAWRRAWTGSPDIAVAGETGTTGTTRVPIAPAGVLWWALVRAVEDLPIADCGRPLVIWADDERLVRELLAKRVCRGRAAGYREGVLSCLDMYGTKWQAEVVEPEHNRAADLLRPRARVNA